MPLWPEAAGIAAGATLLLAAVIWRVVAGRLAVAGVRRALLDPDPVLRRKAVFLTAEQGIGRFAELLLERTSQDPSRPVRDALAEVVARTQWEPADKRELVELRLWAHGHRGGGRAETDAPIADHGPRGLVPADPAPAEVSVAVSSATPVAPEPARPRRLAARAPRARPLRARGPVAVLVTGAGGPAGVAVIRALRAAGHPVLGADADRLAVGLRLAHQSVVLPPGDDPGFIDAVCEAAETTGAQALVSTVAEELIALADGEAELRASGLATWLPDPTAVHACIDKWRFAQVLETAGLAGPPTALGTADGVPGPWIVKPRRGRGSRDVHAVERKDELSWVLPRVEEPIVQTRLDGREFTIDCLVDHDGALVGAVPRWRLETKAGVSTKGRTFADELLCKEAATVLAAVGLTGPANVQGFVAVDGTATFVEVNPRFSGGLPLALASGADLVGEYLRGVLGEALRPDRLAFRPGLTMVRHYEEIFE